MAELAASMVVAPLLSLVKEKASNYLLDRYKVMEGMEKHREALELKLPAILDIIADAEKQASHRQGVKAWLQKLKTVAYEASEAFDDFEYEALRRQAKKQGHVTKLGTVGVALFPTHNRLAFRIRMGNKLRRVAESIDGLVTEMNSFGFQRQLEQASAPVEWRETDSVIVDPDNIVSRSRAEERKKIVDILVNGHASDGGLLVVPIVGMGGLGKTTLAQLIYNDPEVKKHFQLLKWVCVSDDFNMHNLANKICNASEKTREKALQKLQEEHRGKRYLLVLDDVWNTDVYKWEKLKACLKHGDVGSAILTTTRNKEIAQFMSTVDESWMRKYHDMESLGIEFIKEIIEKRAFSLQNKRDDLVNLVGLIAGRCAGSPLAAEALGSLLRNKTTKEEWEAVLQQSNICSDESRILAILKLSYNDLPSDMKQCFAFCAMYPKDYYIEVGTLIELWMANGFISDHKISGQTTIPAETFGKKIVNELASRAFFQYVERGPKELGYSSTTLLKIHDLMHDVAVSASEKECICITDEMIQRCESFLGAARHIYLPERRKTRFDILYRSMKKMSVPIQTLVLGGFYSSNVQDSSRYSSFRALSMPRVLDLMIKPKHLLHLRYLDLSHNNIKALPDDITILYNLQTLKLSDCWNLERLPQQLKYMTALRHLYTHGCHKLECMPPELGRLTFLRTVTCFVVGSCSDCSSLSELNDLNIGGSLELKHLENVAEATNAKAANLGNKKELRQLSLHWTSGKEKEKQCQEVLEALNAHDGLLALKISSYQGTSFPSWMGMLRNITDLRLFNCMKIKELPPLDQLLELQLLELTGLEELEFLCSICTSSTFGKLKDLKLFRLDNFDRFFQVVQGEPVAFPQLQRQTPFPLLETASIFECPQLTALPSAPMLRKLEVGHENQPMSLGEVIRYLTSLSTLKLLNFKVDGNEKWDHMSSSVTKLWLTSCDGFFQLHALALWACFGKQLQDLRIKDCHDLVHWPEAEFKSLVSLRRLEIRECDNLTGYAAHATEQAKIERCQLLPCLESLDIWHCESLVEAFSNLALKRLFVCGCRKLESLFTPGKQQDSSLNQGPSTDFVPSSSLESIWISGCPELSEVVNLPSSLREIRFESCSKLRLLSGKLDALKSLKITWCPELSSLESCVIELPALEELDLWCCKSLASLPSGRQEYSSLRRLAISRCPCIKSLPSDLQQRLDSHSLDLEYKYLDAHHQGLLGRIRSSLSPSSCLR